MKIADMVIHATTAVPRSTAYLYDRCSRCERGKVDGLPCPSCLGTGIAAVRIEGWR